jgi:hypothetical protein
MSQPPQISDWTGNDNNNHRSIKERLLQDPAATTMSRSFWESRTRQHRLVRCVTCHRPVPDLGVRPFDRPLSCRRPIHSSKCQSDTTAIQQERISWRYAHSLHFGWGRTISSRLYILLVNIWNRAFLISCRGASKATSSIQSPIQPSGINGSDLTGPHMSTWNVWRHENRNMN